MYICLYVFTLGSAGMQLNSYGANGAKELNDVHGRIHVEQFT